VFSSQGNSEAFIVHLRISKDQDNRPTEMSYDQLRQLVGAQINNNQALKSSRFLGIPVPG
jgi:YD repeat-containing protein